MTTLRIGTRRSELARWQADHVAAELRRLWPRIDIEMTLIKTMGDKILDRPLADIGDKALFTKELEDALLAGTIDLAVHSLKDLPTRLPAGLGVAAVLARGPFGDAWVARDGQMKLADVPQGTTIATGSLRRRSQIWHARPDLKIVDLRGNVGTRLDKLRQSDWAGVILAEAGLKRLGKEDLITEIIPPTLMLPAVGQGALAIETREGDTGTLELLAPMNDPTTRACVEAERAFLRRLEGGCQVPIGAHAEAGGNEGLTLHGMIASLDGKVLFRDSLSGSAEKAAELGGALAEALLARGAQKILDDIRAEIDKGAKRV